MAGAPVASTGAAAFTHEEVDTAPAAEDALATATGEELLTGLRGKDVLIVFVESYGRVAVEDPAISPEVNGVLTRGTDSPGPRLFRPQCPHLAHVRRDQLASPQHAPVRPVDRQSAAL